MPLCTADPLRNLPPPRPQGWRPKFGQDELVDLPPAGTSSSDAVSIGLPQRPTAQVRSEARNHHRPCPLCPSARPSRPLWPSVTALGAAHVLFPPCKPGPAHPICTLSVPPLISLPVCKNSSHSPSPFPCLSRRHRGGIGATCPPPANISRLGRILSHGDPKRAPGAEFCALLHDALACVHACRACCSCLVQKSGPCARLPVRASRCGCMLSLHICELMHDITSISYVH